VASSVAFAVARGFAVEACTITLAGADWAFAEDYVTKAAGDPGSAADFAGGDVAGSGVAAAEFGYISQKGAGINCLAAVAGWAVTVGGYACHMHKIPHRRMPVKRYAGTNLLGAHRPGSVHAKSLSLSVVPGGERSGRLAPGQTVTKCKAYEHACHAQGQDVVANIHRRSYSFPSAGVQSAASLRMALSALSRASLATRHV